jgi:hypothetical protein
VNGRQSARVPEMVRERSATLALCLVAGLGLIACGGESTVETSSGKPPAERQVTGKPEGDSNPAGVEATGKSAKPQQAEPHASKEGRAESGYSEGDRRSKGQPPGELTDQDRCDRKPSACGRKETPPDYSNPDVRRAEERAEEPDEPTECHSTDCEELRKAEG